jgi:two-component system phosphate regulon response regulator PhoB
MSVAKVLIADDQESMRSLIRLTLESGHFEIIEAADGGSASHLAQEHQPDLVFLDWTMPGLSGIEVCRKLREDPRTADAKIVMVSGRADVAEQAAGFAAGADDYITKPFSPLELLDKVSEVLGPEAFI